MWGGGRGGGGALLGQDRKRKVVSADGKFAGRTGLSDRTAGRGVRKGGEDVARDTQRGA